MPLRGFKLAYPVVSADGARAGFGGIALGRSAVYGVLATAECAQGVQHRSPSRWCDCGFYCVHTMDEARALACDPDYRHAVILEVAASGRFMRYERGLRYARQRVTTVRVGCCGCGRPAAMLAGTGDGLPGWWRLAGCCPACARGRPGLLLSEFARLLGGPPVRPDDAAWPRLPRAPVAAPRPAVEPGLAAGPALDEADRDALVPLLSAEVALLQARLDEVQRQLARLTAGD